jgi:hypothetical protein
MWAALNDIAAERGKTVHDVVLEINRGARASASLRRSASLLWSTELHPVSTGHRP